MQTLTLQSRPKSGHESGAIEAIRRDFQPFPEKIFHFSSPHTQNQRQSVHPSTGLGIPVPMGAVTPRGSGDPRYAGTLGAREPVTVGDARFVLGPL